MSESFRYDALNRLTSATVGMNPAKTFTYNAIGNLLSKSDVGTYSYPAPGQPRPHAVTGISGGALTTTFTYDQNGNVTSGAGLSYEYRSFDMPTYITRGTTTILISYDPEHHRFRQSTPSGMTLYLWDPRGSGVNAERFTSSGPVRWTNYLFAGGEMIGMRRLQRRDHLHAILPQGSSRLDRHHHQ
ncbi:hypothetical protein [Pseudorhodoplanes sinuspersici]|uniref:Uncharacterized protein n=1 Tax=Pseudorhodoplanes sinuspersici TaxID=1235591 RepID=A0A1W6ZYW7_9HYPH|nr:hypothetical protein [Pseudorhodoplanes sinuspersici]ARQ02524.1 hypothetical protein CAK95_27980 [Pseudorhodoplanes sinuspersici]